MKTNMTFKKWVHTSTALVFLFQQIAPTFAMEVPEEERDFGVLRTLPTSSTQLSQSLPLPEDLISSQQTLQTLILESTHASPDPFTPLLADIKQEFEAVSPEVRGLIKNKLPNLLEGSLSLLPQALLRFRDRISFESSLSPNHAAFKRLQEVMGFLDGFQQSPLLTVSPLKEKLQRLRTHYQDYVSLLCRTDPLERLPYLSAISFATEFLESPQVISKEMAYDLLSLNEYGLITKANDTGSSPVAKVGQIYVKKNLTKSRLSSSSDSQSDPSIQEATLNPAMEWAMSTFHHLLFGDGLVRSSLVLLPSVPHKDPFPSTEGERLIQEASDPNISKRDRDTIINRLHEEEELQRDFRSITKSYMAQATEEAKGEFLSTFLERALQDPSLFHSLDTSQVQGVVLSSFLLAFGDAKGDNFMVTFPNAQGKRKIISIDNDWALESFILEERPGFHVLGARNLLFFIPEFMNQSLYPAVRERFLSYTPGVFLLRWLRTLHHHNERYEALGRLYPQALLEADPQHSLHLKLRPGTARELLGRFTQLQDKIRLNPDLKLQDLFMAISPLTALYCQDLVAQETGPLKAFDKAYNRQAFFEHVLGPKLSQTHKGVTFQETLRKETTPLNAYKHRTQSLLEAVQEELELIDFQALAPQESLIILEEAAAYFPDILKRAIQSNGSLLGSFIPLLQNSMSLSLVKLFIETVPELLTQVDEQGYSLLHRAIVARMPENIITYLLEKGMDPDLPTPSKSPFRPLSPLDMACTSYEPHLSSAFTALVKAGEKLVAPQLALQFYQKLMSSRSFPSFSSNKERVSSYETLLSSFLTLLERNQQLAWEFSLFHLLPEADKRPGDVVVRTPDSKTRILSSDLQKQLFDQDLRLIRRNKEGKRDVGIIERHIHGVPLRFYVKEYPELPGLEEAVGSFMRRLFGFGAPYTDLVRIGNLPFLVSQEIRGKTAADVFKETPQFFDSSDVLDPYYTSALILMNMLINPEDGIFPNYIIEKLSNTNAHRLISVDNDHAFVPGVAKVPVQGLFSSAEPIVQVKTILFGLDHMLKAVHPDVRIQFLKVDIGEFLEGWLRDLRQRNALYGDLFTQQERLSLLPKKPDDPKSKGTYVGIPFQDNAIKDLYQKMSTLQSLLQGSPQLTHLELLSKVEPHVGHRYGKGFIPSGKNFKDRIQFVDGVNSHLSMSTSGRLFKSMHIPLKESLLETSTKDATKTQDYRPNKALEELKEIRRQHAGLVLFDSQRTGGASSPAPTLNLAHLKTLKLEEHFEQLLGQRSFKDITETDQRALFEMMRGRKFKHLILRDAYALQDKLFQGIQLEYLLTLNLEGCLALTDEVVPLIAGKALSLESLNLSRITTNMREIGKQRKGIFDVTPLYILFPSLRYFNISYGGIRTVLIDAPKLEVFKSMAAKELQALDIRQKSEVPLEAVFSTLKKVDLREVQSLSLQTFLQLLQSHANLLEVQTEGARNLPTIPRIFFQDIKVPLERENLERFNVLYHRATDGNDPEAQYELGRVYTEAKGVKQNIKRAREWYQKAFPNVPFEEISSPFNIETLKKLNQLYKRATEGNDPEAQFQLGDMYARGHGVKQNHEKAFEWCKKAADLNHAEAQYKLGDMYANGQGVKQNIKRAREWYQKAFPNVPFEEISSPFNIEALKKLNQLYKRATEGNDPEVQFQLGDMYANGQEVKQNVDKAMEWYQRVFPQVPLQDITPPFNRETLKRLNELYKRATEDNDPEAHSVLSEFYKKGKEIKQNESQAEYWLGRAVKSFQNIFPYVLVDDVMPPLWEGDLKQLNDLFQCATEDNDSNAQYKLCEMYANGQSMKQNIDKAMEWYQRTLPQVPFEDFNPPYYRETLKELNELYKRAAEENDPDAQHELCEMYANGQSMKQNIDKAREWYQRTLPQVPFEDLNPPFKKGTLKKLNELYKRATENNDPEAQHELCEIYGEGQGVKQNMERVREWCQKTFPQVPFEDIDPPFKRGTLKKLNELYKRATEGNDPEAQVQLGDMYANGQGIKQNMKRAKEWYKKTIQNDHPIGKKVLQLIENQKNKEELDFSFKYLTSVEMKFVMVLLTDQPLQKLYLGGNIIGDEGVRALSEVLKSNTSLQVLDLGNNNLGDEGVRALSEVLRSNTTLQLLGLEENNIGDEGVRALSEVLRSNTTLQLLGLGENNIGDEGTRALSEGLRSNTSLQGLSLYQNFIGAEGARALSEGLRGNATLQKLSLHKNNIGDEGAKALSEGLRGNTSLQVLNLGNNNLGDEGARFLSEGFKGNVSLQELNLWSNKIGAEGTRFLSEFLRGNTSLQVLDLRYNKIGAEGARFLSEGLRGNTSLQVLDLRYDTIGAEGVRFLSEGLRGNTSLRELGLTANSIGDERVRALSEALRGNTTLQKLSLSYNHIGDEGACFLSEGLKGNASLQELDLNLNNIGDEGVRALSEFLKGNTTLQKLDLGHNDIKDEGARFLSEFLKGNASLQELSLGNNNLGAEGVRALSEFFKGNTTLQKLDLGHNDIKDEGARFLSKGLRGNTSLQGLDLNNNNIGDEGVRVLSEVIKGNSSLQQLKLWGNKIGDEGKRSLNELKKQSPQLKIEY